MNEQYQHAADARGRRRDGILKGMYMLQADQQAEGEAARAAVRQRRHPD